MANTRNRNVNANNNAVNLPPPSPDPRASPGDASPNGLDHAPNHGQHGIEPGGTVAAIERQAWGIPKDQAANILTLCGADEGR
jgi:hypothetical protein